MPARRIACVAAAALAAALLLVSAAWACTTAGGPYINDLFARRSPVGAVVAVGGGGWQASSPLQLHWRAASGAVGDRQVLATAVTDPSGGLAASVTVPAAAAGFYYVGVTQGATTRETTLEVVTDPPAARVAAEPAAGGTGLPALSPPAPTEPPGQGSSGGGSTLLPVGIAAGFGLVALVGVVAAERRRRSPVTRGPN